MKWYRAYTLALIVGSVSGTLYHRSKEDAKLRRALIQMALASLCYTSCGLAATAFIPRFHAGCAYYTLTALLTSSNFLFTRQFLIEKGWVHRKELSPPQNLYATSAVAGAETGFVLEAILAEGGAVSTLKSMSFWALVAVAVQFCLLRVEAWRIKKSLQLHSPQLFPPSHTSSPEAAVDWMHKVLLHEWKIDIVRRENNDINLRLVRELDRVRQARSLLRDNSIPDDSQGFSSD